MEKKDIKLGGMIILGVALAQLIVVPLVNLGIDYAKSKFKAKA